jgi:hypothetical protein
MHVIKYYDETTTVSSGRWKKGTAALNKLADGTNTKLDIVRHRSHDPKSISVKGRAMNVKISFFSGQLSRGDGCVYLAYISCIRIFNQVTQNSTYACSIKLLDDVNTRVHHRQVKF